MQKPVLTSTSLSTRKHVSPKSPHTSMNNSVVRNQTNNTAKRAEDSNSGYEAKLVEMINASIVDRSPSVKWEDVGEKILL